MTFCNSLNKQIISLSNSILPLFTRCLRLADDPQAGPVLVSNRNHDLWVGPTVEVYNSQLPCQICLGEKTWCWPKDRGIWCAKCADEEVVERLAIDN